MTNLTDEEILLHLADTEHSFVERKTANDLKDCLKTVIAFANTAPVGYPAILFVGVRDNGAPEGTVVDLDKLQLKLSEKISGAYPPIYTSTRILTKDGKKFLAVIVLGSESRPHFAGPAYIRDGSKSIPASEAQFGRLIAERSSKTYEILKQIGKGVTLTQKPREYMVGGTTFSNQPKTLLVTVSDCNLHYVTLASVSRAGDLVSYPLSIIELNFDNLRKRLELILSEGPIPDWPSC